VHLPLSGHPLHHAATCPRRQARPPSAPPAVRPPRYRPRGRRRSVAAASQHAMPGSPPRPVNRRARRGG